MHLHNSEHLCLKESQRNANFISTIQTSIHIHWQRKRLVGFDNIETDDRISIHEPEDTYIERKMIDYNGAYPNNPGASNDSGIDYLAPYSYVGPQTQLLSCIAANENELLLDYGASATTFEFDYELHTPKQADVTLIEAVDEFQNGLARSIAADYGVYCNSRGRILEKEFSMNETDDTNGEGGPNVQVCLGVSSSPSDVPDDFICE